jgi:hypothetical protein
MSLPSNLEEAFAQLKIDLLPSDQIEIMNMPKEKLCRLHTNLGRWIRNNWKLWQSGPMTKYFNDLGIHHADDMSGIVIESFWHHLRNEPLDLDKQVAYYKEFWAINSKG